MIDINLIPSTARKKTGVLTRLHIDIPQEILFGVGGGVIALIFLMHGFLILVWGLKSVGLATRQAAWSKVLPDKNNIDALGNEIKDIKKKLNSIQGAMSSKGLGWSKRLNIISDQMPKGIWLKSVALDPTALVIEGKVISRNQSEATIVGSYVNALRKDPFFMQDFVNVEISSIQKEKKGTIDISTFVIVAKLK